MTSQDRKISFHAMLDACETTDHRTAVLKTLRNVSTTNTALGGYMSLLEVHTPEQIQSLMGVTS